MPTVQLNKVKSTIYILLAHILSGRYNKAYRKVCLFLFTKGVNHETKVKQIKELPHAPTEKTYKKEI